MSASTRLEVTARPAFVPDGVGSNLTVIIVNYNTGHLLQRCVEHLRAAAEGLQVQLIIVDNASRDGSAALVRQALPDALLIENAVNVGFGRANNQALACSQAPCVLLLNSDAFVYPDTLRRSLQHMATETRCGVLGVRSVDEQGRELFVGRAFPTPWKNFQLQTGLFKAAAPSPGLAAPAPADLVMDCDWVVGCYYLVRREVIEQVGLFDPRFFLYFEEVDHCKTVRQAGWRVQCLLTTQVVHEGGASAATEGVLDGGRQLSALQTESNLLYFRKHGGLAGVLSTATLALAGEAVVAAKRLLRQRGWVGLGNHWRNTLMWCRLLVQTRAGMTPTR